MIKAVFIVGPTASGKTALSIEIAKRFSGEIVSADSMQIYKGIHIASAAPSDEEKCSVPHHLIEFLDLSKSFSVADYVKLARKTIKDINDRGNLPIIVGGTGLYINSLLDNIEFCDQETNFDLRKELEEKFDLVGGETMLNELADFDSETAKELHPNNRRRIIRAFELYIETGKTKTEQNILSRQNSGEIFPLVIGINYKDREILYNRINKRVDIMLHNGLLEEAKQNLNYNATNGGFQAIGHKELYGYFKGECSLEEATENLKMQTRRYAKRQNTWFKRDERINWFYPDEDKQYIDKAILLTKKFLEEEN